MKLRGAGLESIQFWLKNDEIQNFGDYLSAYFADKLFVSAPRTFPNVHVIGSVISDYWVEAAIRDSCLRGPEPSVAAIFWGCGLRQPMGSGDQSLSAHLRERICIKAVRGPLSARELGLDPAFPLGDPGLLMPFLYEPVPVAGLLDHTIVAPHFFDTRNDDELCAITGADSVLRPNIARSLSEIERFVDTLCSSRFVLAGSLHAAIVAAAYGVPFAFWDSGNIDIPFKWEDFAESVNIPCVFHAGVESGIAHFCDAIEPQMRIPSLLPLLSSSPFEVKEDVLTKVLSHKPT